jgi:molybdenum cofactor cytidylyltransferase
MDEKRSHIPGIIILAAGESSRMGEPKQLLTYEGTSLIRRIADAAVRAVDHPVVTVLGANCELIHPHLIDTPVHVVVNFEWRKGLSSSIGTGLKALLHFSPETEAVIFTLCDQPYVTHEVFSEMISLAQNTSRTIVACAYNNTLGNPVLFKKEHFAELLGLNGQAGAKKVIEQHPESVESLPFSLGGVDIDTMQDYESLQKPVM